jgi:hypothetical protein
MQTPALQAAQVAGRFRDLQGLRQAVAGIGLLLFFVWELFFPLSSAAIRAEGIGAELWSAAILVPGVVLTVIAVLRVNAWYRRTYGQVEQTRNQKRLGKFVGLGGVLAVIGPFEVDVFAQNYGYVVPVNLAMFTLALWIVGYWLYMGRPFWHYIVIAGVGVLLGIGSIAGFPPSSFDSHLRETTLYIAVASIVGGVVDHVILTRSLAPSESPVGLES